MERSSVRRLFRDWLRVAFIIPSIVPGVVGILLWKQMYDPQIGLINEILKAVVEAVGDLRCAIWRLSAAGAIPADDRAFRNVGRRTEARFRIALAHDGKLYAFVKTIFPKCWFRAMRSNAAEASSNR